MEKQLKERFDAAVDAALDGWRRKRDRGSSSAITTENELREHKQGAPRAPKLGSKSTKNGLESIQTASAKTGMSAQEKERAWIAGFIRRHLRRDNLVRKIEKALAADAIAAILEKRIGAIERASVDESQLALPGYEHLPKHIGRPPIANATVSKFLDYQERYSKKADRDQRVAAELKKVAERVLRFQITEPDLPLSEALRRADEPKGLAIVHRAGGA